MNRKQEEKDQQKILYFRGRRGLSGGVFVVSLHVVFGSGRIGGHDQRTKSAAASGHHAHHRTPAASFPRHEVNRRRGMTQHDMTNLRTRLRVISTTAVLLYHQITFNGQNRNLVNIKRLMNDEIRLFETEEIKFSIFDFGQFYKIRFGLNLQECSFSKILAQKWQKK